MIQEFETPKRLSFVRREHEYEDVYSYFFEPLDDFSFLAGQNARVVAPDLPEEECSRSLSFANAPHEKEVQFAMHVRKDSAYKMACSSLREGDEMHIVKVKGATVLPEDPKTPVGMLAGGIGVTPFRSILMHMAHENITNPALLIHVSRETFLYEDELKGLPYEQKRVGREGFAGSVEEAVGKYPDAKYLLAGSPSFIEAGLDALKDHGVSEEKTAFSRFKQYEGLLD